MNELSYYCTIASLVLLQISFYWLYKQERRSRDTAKSKYDDDQDHEESKVSDGVKVVLVVANKENLVLGELLREKLEAAKFIVYELRFSSKLQEPELILQSLEEAQRKEPSQRGRTIWLNLELDRHLELAVGLVESQKLSKCQMELCGYVRLLFSGSDPRKGHCNNSDGAQVGSSPLENLLPQLARPIKLLVAFSSLIGFNSKSQIVLVAPTTLHRARKTEVKSQDYKSLFGCNMFVSRQLVRVGLLSLIVVAEEEDQARPRWLSRAIGKIMRPTGSSPVGGGGKLEVAATIVDLVVNKIRDNGR